MHKPMLTHAAFILMLSSAGGAFAAENAAGEDSADQAVTNQTDANQESTAQKNTAKENAVPTPPWGHDSASVHQQEPLPDALTPIDSPEDFSVRPEWGKRFADPDHFSATSGEELYQTLCQACHMEDGQGAHGAGDYPSFVGNERLRSPYYAIDVILNGFRGMPHFSDKLDDQQVADVVNYLRTSFGNQLEDDATADDVAGLRHSDDQGS